MKILKYTMMALLFLSFALSTSPLGYALKIRHFDIDVEAERIDEKHRFPMLGIYRMLKRIIINCDRLPFENEFKDFILNGRHPNIKCSELIKTWTSDRGNIAVGKKIPNLSQFLNEKNFKVFSDSKSIVVSSHHDPKNWHFKDIKGDEADMVIRCTFVKGNCQLSWLKQQMKNCRRDKNFAKNNCYLGNMKVIDY